MINSQDLGSFPLIKGLKSETIQFISQSSFKREVNAGKVLVNEGASAHHCYFLLSGHVRVLKVSQDGRLQILGRFGPGSPLNIIPMLTCDGINQASIETLTQTSVIVINTNTFTDLVSKYPDFSFMIMKFMAERMARMVNLASDLSFHSVRIRLARLLIDLAEQPFIEIGWTQDEIAAQIGTIRDVVGRILRDFEAKGLIARNRQEIKLLDKDGLHHEAKLPRKVIASFNSD